jgi:hypothetical protein
MHSEPAEPGIVAVSVSLIFKRMDEAVRNLGSEHYWAFRTGIIAIAFGLLAHTPVTSTFADLGNSSTAEVIRAQIAHPLTPLDLENFKGIAHNPGRLSHEDKIAFRIAIPIIGKLLHTGAASFLLLDCIGGLLFFPMLASIANRIFQDRVSAAYVTFAFALTWSGSHFFDDSQFGDGFAWICLLSTIYFRNPFLIFSGVLLAAFTDERAIVASAAALLYWLGAPLIGLRYGSRPRGDAVVPLAIGMAWSTYFAVRLYLSYAFGLRSGTTEVFEFAIIWDNLARSIPYLLLTVFQGLWLWMATAMLALCVTRRIVLLCGFISTLACLLVLALSVWDFQRSAGYAFLLLPVAWQAGGLERATIRTLARSCFVLGLCLVVPANTVLRYFYHLHQGPPLTTFG